MIKLITKQNWTGHRTDKVQQTKYDYLQSPTNNIKRDTYVEKKRGKEIRKREGAEKQE